MFIHKIIFLRINLGHASSSWEGEKNRGSTFMELCLLMLSSQVTDETEKRIFRNWEVTSNLTMILGWTQWPAWPIKYNRNDVLRCMVYKKSYRIYLGRTCAIGMLPVGIQPPFCEKLKAHAIDSPTWLGWQPAITANHFKHPSPSGLQMTPVPATVWLQLHETPSTKSPVTN